MTKKANLSVYIQLGDNDRIAIFLNFKFKNKRKKEKNCSLFTHTSINKSLPL